MMISSFVRSHDDGLEEDNKVVAVSFDYKQFAYVSINIMMWGEEDYIIVLQTNMKNQRRLHSV